MWNTNDKANKSQVEKVKLDSEMLLFPDLSLVLKFHWNKVESNWSLKLFKAVLYCLGKMARVKRFNQNLKMYFCSFIFLKLAYLYSFTFCTIYVVQCTKNHQHHCGVEGVSGDPWRDPHRWHDPQQDGIYNGNDDEVSPVEYIGRTCLAEPFHPLVIPCLQRT